MTEVKENGVAFYVEDGVLKKMVNCGGVKNVKIPCVMSNNLAIDCIGKEFCCGEYLSIEISDEIKNISERAFDSANVKKIRWSEGCKIIPDGCFSFSGVEKISNITHVEGIDQGAFFSSKLQEFCMPPNCNKIPTECFLSSRLKTISNLDHVTEIGKAAFEGCDIQSIVWPTGCKSIPDCCFNECSKLSNISNIENVVSIGAWAFRDTSSLTRFAWPSKCKCIPKYCFAGSGIKTIENIENVVNVDDAVFAYSALEEIKWPSGCSVIPYECFWASELRSFDFDNITHIEERAFGYANPVSKFDMSNCPVTAVDKSSFFKVSCDNVVFPYYMSKEEIENAFGDPFKKQP